MLLLLFLCIHISWAGDAIEIILASGEHAQAKAQEYPGKMAKLLITGTIQQTIEGMGSKFVPFKGHGAGAVMACDLDNDGHDEIITQTFWEVSKAVHVFHYFEQGKVFHIVKTKAGEDYLIFQKGSELKFNCKEKTITFYMGKAKQVLRWNKRYFEK